MSDHADTIRRCLYANPTALAALDALLAERQQAQELHAKAVERNAAYMDQWSAMRDQRQQAIGALREIAAFEGGINRDDAWREIAAAALVKLGEQP